MDYLIAVGIWFFCGFIAYGFYKGQRRACYQVGVYDCLDESGRSISPPKRLLYSKKEERAVRILFLLGTISLLLYLIYRGLCLIGLGLVHDKASFAEITSLKFCLWMPKELCEKK